MCFHDYHFTLCCLQATLRFVKMLIQIFHELQKKMQIVRLQSINHFFQNMKKSYLVHSELTPIIWFFSSICCWCRFDRLLLEQKSFPRSVEPKWHELIKLNILSSSTKFVNVPSLMLYLQSFTTNGMQNIPRHRDN